MLHRLLLACVSIACAALCACSTPWASQRITSERLSRIVPGLSRAQVQAELGAPASEGRVAAWPHNILTYRWRDIDNMLFWVYLDAHDVVQKTEQGVEYIRDLPDN